MAPQLPFRVPQLGPRTRRILRYVTLTFFALAVFVFALQMTFPYDRVKDKVVDALSDKYEVTIGGVERGFVPGRVYFNAVTLRSIQTKPEEVVTTFFIKRLELDAGLLSLVGGTISLNIEAQIGAGTLSGSISVGKFGRGDISANFVGSHLPGDALPMRSALGLPITGKIEFNVSLGLPMEKSKLGKTAINWQKARGSFALGCPAGCTIGDGVTKLKPLLKNTRNQVMVGEGIDFGKVNLDSLLAKATIKGGKLTLDKFDAKSKDGELKVDYAMTLEKEWGESMVAGCLRFKGSDELLKREAKTYAAIQTTGAELRGDGLFHIKLTDRFKDMKRLNQECGPGVQTNNGENFSGTGKPDRPNLTVQPDEGTRPGSAMAAPPPPTPTPMDTPAIHDAAVNPNTGGPAGPPPATPTPLPDGAAAAPVMSNDPPPPGARERPGEQGRIEGSAAGSGSSNATPPAE